MANLIDPEKLLSAMKSVSNPIYTYHAISRIIESLPTVDIVRCKDCKYYWQNDPHNGIPVCLVSPEVDAFCSEGERREDE